jgi:hypothetical protein
MMLLWGLTAGHPCRLSSTRSRLLVQCSLAWRILFFLPWLCSRLAFSRLLRLGLTDLLSFSIGSSVSRLSVARWHGRAIWSPLLASPRPNSPNNAEVMSTHKISPSCRISLPYKMGILLNPRDLSVLLVKSVRSVLTFPSWRSDILTFPQEVQGHNPQGNIQSFDTIYHSALQVFIVASANGVGGLDVLSSPSS